MLCGKNRSVYTPTAVALHATQSNSTVVLNSEDDDRKKEHFSPFGNTHCDLGSTSWEHSLEALIEKRHLRVTGERGTTVEMDCERVEYVSPADRKHSSASSSSFYISSQERKTISNVEEETRLNDEFFSLTPANLPK